MTFLTFYYKSNLPVTISKILQTILAFKKCSQVKIMRSDFRVGWDYCFDFVGSKRDYQICTAFFIFLIFQSVDNPSNFVLTK